LHCSEEHKSCKAPSTGERAKAEREARQSGKEVAYEHRLQGFSVFLHPQGDDEESKGNAAADGHEVPEHVPRAQLVKEKEHHSANYKDHREPVKARGNLAKEPLAEEGNIHRSAVLEKDSIGSGSEFVGKNKEHHRCRVSKAPKNLKTGEAEAGAKKAQEKSTGDGTPDSGNRHGIPGYEFDEKATETPEQGSGKEVDNGPFPRHVQAPGFFQLSMGFALLLLYVHAGEHREEYHEPKDHVGPEVRDAHHHKPVLDDRDGESADENPHHAPHTTPE